MIGDSSVRQLFYAVVKKAVPDASTDADRHAFVYFKDVTLNTTFEFYWDPFLNITGPISAWSSEEKPSRKPSILLVGSGLWYLRHSDWTGGVAKWREVMQMRIDQMSDPSSSVSDHVFIAPISAVNTEKLSHERMKTLLPTDINAMNTFLKEATRNSTITVPFSWTHMTETSADATEHGLHSEEKVRTAEADVLLNFLCNNKLPKQPPMSATCCYDYPANRWFQTVMLIIFLLWLPLAHYMQNIHSNSAMSKLLPSPTILRAMTVMAASVLYMYFADRTSLFAKNNKMYSSSTFAILLLLIVFAGCVTFKESDKNATFLNRDQTDEWKGWMQLVILTYHYVGASGVSPIYNPVRMLVASYLFMTGFGHFVFFYKKADFGFKRVATIMVRLNLLTILIIHMMDTTYLTYYFAPLVSFFYLIIYAMMYVGHSLNHKPIFILSKIVITAIITALFVHVPSIIDTVFAALGSVFGISWSSSEWRFRLQLDVWIVFVGALVGYGSIKAQELSITDHTRWNIIRQSAIALSVVGVLGYVWFAASRNKFEYNIYHPLISWIPIISFVVLRNSTTTLRSTTSTFCAFIGKCSLETFVAQYHIWLAGDTKGILV
ncbi:hypothetical protein BGZ72_000503, partial [Mortierella alpina]